MERALKLKVCGMRDPGNVAEVCSLRPDYMGFIFFPGSVRYVGETAEKAIGSVADGIRAVGVFVNQSIQSVMQQARRYGFSCIQLHGRETAWQCAQLRSEGLCVIKAFSVRGKKDLEGIAPYADHCDFFLFDTPGQGYGGTGKKFDWSLLDGFRSPLPFFLSGGIGPYDAEEINLMEANQLYGVDINSRFELEPGLKDVQQLKEFTNKLRH